MKEKYVTPEIEITEFEEEVCVTMSGNGGETGADNFLDMESTGWE